jgi:uroporphyrin-III C-methyltransferase/precorrin-2 dehydrogenase/sirohydrochlorin ferrochelatase
MKHFPIFVALDDRRVALSGGGEAALAKLRLLLKTNTKLTVYSTDPAPEIESWGNQARLTLIQRPLAPGDTLGCTLFYAADEDATEDARTAAIARADGAMVNIVDNLTGSDFITPAIVDRAPVTVAIGTEGTAPVLARAIKADLEERLPSSLGILARAAMKFRHMADRLPMGRARRLFWTDFFFKSGPHALDSHSEADLGTTLRTQLKAQMAARPGKGRITFAVVASADPELLPLKTRNILHEADLVLHGRDIAPEVFELARREAKFGALPETALPLTKAAANGQHVICLTATAPPAPLLLACRAAGIDTHIIPGIAPLPVLIDLEETA